MQNKLEILQNITHFIWDEHNKEKNWRKHHVKYLECEEVFFNNPLFILEDEKHSQKEPRWFATGITNNKRKLFTVFTIRNKGIRIISSRDMNKKERIKYEKLKKNPSL